MSACHIPPKDKKKLGTSIGSGLLREYGKKRFYSIGEIKAVMQKQAYPIDFYCWGFALFASPFEFESYHRKLGESCDYSLMKSEMVEAMTNESSSSWFNIDMSWFEWPDFDFSDLFDVGGIDV